MSPNSIELLILDVDGVLTDGRLTMGATGEPDKAFFVRDGLALKLWQRSGGKVAILSGRREAATARRAKELGIEWVVTGIVDKSAEYGKLLDLAGVHDRATAYMGDDLPDLGPMEKCGFPIAVANAAPAVKRQAMYVTRSRGGEGAVAEVVELLLRRSRRWSRETLTTVGG